MVRHGVVRAWCSDIVGVIWRLRGGERFLVLAPALWGRKKIESFVLGMLLLVNRTGGNHIPRAYHVACA